MNRLDRHVGMIQNKLTLERFLKLLGYAVALFFGAVLVYMLANRFFWKELPHEMIWFWSAAGVAVVTALVIAIIRRPSQHEVAIFIDDKLGLKEKFSTAIYARKVGGNSDPFLAAAVKDAERTADNVSLHRRFPVEFPKSALMAFGMALVVALVFYFVPKIDLFGKHAQAETLAKKAATERAEAQREGEKALTVISSQTAAMKDMPKVELAKKDDLQRLMNDPKADPQMIKEKALKALEEAETQAKLEEMKQNQAFAQAQADSAVFSSLNPAADDKGPVADASRDIANGDFAKAVQAMQSLPAKFNDLKPDEQQKETKQMDTLAKQLQKLANDPAAMNNLKQQLQQQGITQKQVQQAANLAQQAAQGNQQAAQQLAQMQQQMTQQMNGGKGPSQQQQQAIAQAMQQMQSVANTQAQAQQMTGAAQAMAQGMAAAQSAKQGAAGQQTAKAGGNQQGAPKQGGQQQASAQAGGQQGAAGTQAGQQPGGQQGAGQKPGGQQAAGQQGGGQQPGGQQANGTQPGGQQGGGQQAGSQPGGQQADGNQPGGQQGGGSGGQGAGQQQMKQAGEQMAQALGQMDAVKKDAEQVAAMQKAAQQPDDDGSNPGDGGKNGNKPGQQPGGGQGGGPQNAQAGGQPGGGGGAPPGFGGAGEKALAEFTVKQELDPSQNINGGKVLAKTFVKAPQLQGKATIELSPAAKAAVKESTDDVAEESVPKDAQKVVKDYFDTVGGN